MSSPAPLQLGIVGAGAIAQAYLQACEHTSLVDLRAVADCRLEAAQAMAEANRCASFASAEEMVDEMDLEAVLVCTPPATHCEVCCTLLERGLHVLCEKPLSIDSQSARQMVKAAECNDAVFTMASKFRYVEDVKAAKSLVTSGVIGEVVLFENVFAGHVDMTQRWNSNPEVSGGGVLIDNGTHSLDITRYFLGELVDVQAIEGHRIQKLPVEDTVKLFARNRASVLASIDLSWSVSKEQPYYLAIYGSAGTLLVGWRESKYRRAGDNEWRVFGSGYDKVAAFVCQLNNFAGAIRGIEPLVVTTADALASVAVIEAAYRSLAQGSWEPVGDTCETV